MRTRVCGLRSDQSGFAGGRPGRQIRVPWNWRSVSQGSDDATDGRGSRATYTQTPETRPVVTARPLKAPTMLYRIRNTMSVNACRPWANRIFHANIKAYVNCAIKYGMPQILFPSSQGTNPCADSMQFVISSDTCANVICRTQFKTCDTPNLWLGIISRRKIIVP